MKELQSTHGFSHNIDAPDPKNTRCCPGPHSNARPPYGLSLSTTDLTRKLVKTLKQRRKREEEEFEDIAAKVVVVSRVHMFEKM